MPETLKPRDADRLDTIRWGMTHFGSLMTNRQFPLRDMKRLVEKGLAECIGFVELSDGDGGLVYGAERPGYVLTDAGRAAHRAAFPEDYRHD